MAAPLTWAAGLGGSSTRRRRVTLVGHSWGAGFAWAPLTFRHNRRAQYLLQRRVAWSLTERELDRVACPVLILWGTQDGFLPPALAVRFAARLPGGRVQLLPGCGHSLHEDCPAEAHGAMRAFLTASAGAEP